MLLYEIIKTLEDDHTSQVSYENIDKYKKMLYIYYSNKFCTNELVFFATFVTNACCAGRIAPASDVNEHIELTLDDDISDEDRDIDIETMQAYTSPFNPYNK